VSARFEPGRARTGIKRGGVTTSAELKRELDQTVIVQTNAYGEMMRLKEGATGLHAELSERVARLRWQLETAEKREEQERKAKAAEEAEKRRKLDLETDGATARRQQKRWEENQAFLTPREAMRLKDEFLEAPKAALAAALSAKRKKLRKLLTVSS